MQPFSLALTLYVDAITFQFSRSDPGKAIFGKGVAWRHTSSHLDGGGFTGKYYPLIYTRSRLWMLLIALCFCLVGLVLPASHHAPDEPPLIDRKASWCMNGQITRTTGECICSSHRGYFCRDSLGDERQGKTCDAGYGISFFHFTCKTCACINRVKMDELPQANEWRERKQALKMANRKQQRQQVPIV